MLNALRPFLAALLMIPLLSLAGYATAHGITITDEQVHKAVDYLCEVAIPLLAGLAVIVRRLVDKKANPDNAASTHAAVEGKRKQQARKLARSHAKIDEWTATNADGDDDIPPLAKIPSSEKGRPV